MLQNLYASGFYKSSIISLILKLVFLFFLFFLFLLQIWKESTLKCEHTPAELYQSQIFSFFFIPYK